MQGDRKPRPQSRRAGVVRVAFALAALTFYDSVFPGAPSALAVIGSYLVVSLGFQLAIVRGWGAGDWRSMGMGLVDIGFLSYLTHLQGPATSVLPIAYLLIPVINASASSTRSRVAMRLAAVAALAYATLIVTAALGVLPYAPTRPELGGMAPPLAVLACAATLVGMSLVATTSLVLRQVVALDRANTRLRELSQRDELTQLHNRRHLLQAVRRELERVRRGHPAGLMMIDLDGFKRVNDLRGHEAGDGVLIDVARVLARETRAVDLVARHGGDEFVVLLPDLELAGVGLALEPPHGRRGPKVVRQAPARRGGVRLGRVLDVHQGQGIGARVPLAVARVHIHPTPLAANPDTAGGTQPAVEAEPLPDGHVAAALLGGRTGRNLPPTAPNLGGTDRFFVRPEQPADLRMTERQPPGLHPDSRQFEPILRDFRGVQPVRTAHRLVQLGCTLRSLCPLVRGQVGGRQLAIGRSSGIVGQKRACSV